jgi:2-polyprenyl-6-methoxyphenol hydroxylase-like FAD-dependent oxidoreductase
VLKECEKLGLLDDMRQRGRPAVEGFQWRTPEDQVLCRVGAGPQKGLFLGQHKLAEIIMEHIAKLPNVKVIFSYRFAGVREKGSKVTAVFVTPQGEEFLTADYLVGCDGAGSTVRRSLCIPFEGFTWTDFRFIASNIHYDFNQVEGWREGSMLVDPEHWAVIAPTGAPGEPWRVCYGEPSHLDFSKEAIMERLPSKYEKLLPGNKKGYTVELVNPYYAHQRCAKNYRDGRILLCGDAAHVILLLATRANN